MPLTTSDPYRQLNQNINIFLLNNQMNKQMSEANCQHYSETLYIILSNQLFQNRGSTLKIAISKF
jgi:hypothetical protein